MNQYNIEVNYSYDGLTEKESNIKSKQIEKELYSIAEETNGEFFAFDEDFTFDPTNYSMEKIGVNYNWIFQNVEHAQNFLIKLPIVYNILWIHRQNNKGEKECVVFSTRNKPEVNKFIQNDKDLYKIMIDRLKK